jgi:hypothetical protein
VLGEEHGRGQADEPTAGKQNRHVRLAAGVLSDCHAGNLRLPFIVAPGSFDRNG